MQIIASRKTHANQIFIALLQTKKVEWTTHKEGKKIASLPSFIEPTTDIYWVIDYKLWTILLIHQYHKLHELGHDDSAKALVMEVVSFSINN